MDISIFLAQVLGIYFLVMGIAILVRGRTLQKSIKDFLGNLSIKFFAGIFILILGIMMVVSHNIWGGEGWQTVITILAWLTFLKGIFYLFAGDKVFDSLVGMTNKMGVFAIGGIVSIILGGWLSFIGFGL